MTVERRDGIAAWEDFLDLGRGRLASVLFVRCVDFSKELYVTKARLREMNSGSESHGVENRSTSLKEDQSLIKSEQELHTFVQPI